MIKKSYRHDNTQELILLNSILVALNSILVALTGSILAYLVDDIGDQLQDDLGNNLTG